MVDETADSSTRQKQKRIQVRIGEGARVSQGIAQLDDYSLCIPT